MVAYKDALLLFAVVCRKYLNKYKRYSSRDVSISKQKKSDELLVLPQFNINVIKKRDETARILDSFSVSLQFNKLPMIKGVQNIFSKQFSITFSTKFMRKIS